MANNSNKGGRLGAQTPATFIVQGIGEGAVVLANEIAGGLQRQANFTAIEETPGGYLENGMLSYAEDSGKYYKYSGGTFNGASGITSGGSWTELIIGASWIDYVGGIPGDSTFLENGDEIIPYNTDAYFRLITSAGVDSFYQTYVDGVLGELLITRGG